MPARATTSNILPSAQIKMTWRVLCGCHIPPPNVILGKLRRMNRPARRTLSAPLTHQRGAPAHRAPAAWPAAAEIGISMDGSRDTTAPNWRNSFIAPSAVPAWSRSVSVDHVTRAPAPLASSCISISSDRIPSEYAMLPAFAALCLSCGSE